MQNLIITATISLPDDIFEQADVLARMKAARDAFTEAVGDAGRIETRVVTVRAVSAPAAAPRQRRKKEAHADG